MTRSERAAREFSTLRKKSSSTAKVSGLRSAALLYVKGRVPLHLRLVVHDLFDGIAWYPADLPDEDKLPRLSMQREGKRDWLIPVNHTRSWEFLAPVEPHALRSSTSIPTASRRPCSCAACTSTSLTTRRSTNGRPTVCSPSTAKPLPSLTTIHLRSRAVDRRSLTREPTGAARPVAPSTVLPVGGEMDRLRDLALDWTRGVPRGWPQVEAIVDRLKKDYVLDPDHKTSPDSPLPVADFLLRDRRGPDHMFATAAAVLLRSLNYSTRFVTASTPLPHASTDPKSTPPSSGKTPTPGSKCSYPVTPGSLSSRLPGYELLGPPPVGGIDLHPPRSPCCLTHKTIGRR